MPYEVIWGAHAIHDQKRCIDFLKNVNVHAAIMAARLLADAAESLEEFPERSPCKNESDYRELLVPFGNAGYVLRYVIHGERVKVIRLWHVKELRL